MNSGWNPWHGCRKYSEGCEHCYVYRIDAKYERDSSLISLNRDFDLPVRRGKNGEYKIPSGETVWTCFSSDFFLKEADDWRADAWRMIRERQDLSFVFITKRIGRFGISLPDDWGDGYPNVTIGCTCENQRRADERLPLFLKFPIRRRFIVCEPMLEYVDFTRWLDPARVSHVSVGGESGEGARICDYDWVLHVAADAKKAGVGFSYHQTGALLRKDGRVYRIPRNLQVEQAARAGLDTVPRD